VTGAKLLAQRIGKLLGVHEREMIAIGVGETFLNRTSARATAGALKLFPSSAHHYLGDASSASGSSGRGLRGGGVG